MLRLSLFFVLCVLFSFTPHFLLQWQHFAYEYFSSHLSRKRNAFDAPQLLSTAIKQKKKKESSQSGIFFLSQFNLVSSDLKHKHLPSQGLCGASSKSRPMKDCQPTVHIVERDACLSDRIWYRLILKKKKKSTLPVSKPLWSTKGRIRWLKKQ